MYLYIEARSGKIVAVLINLFMSTSTVFLLDCRGEGRGRGKSTNITFG